MRLLLIATRKCVVSTFDASLFDGVHYAIYLRTEHMLVTSQFPDDQARDSMTPNESGHRAEQRVAEMVLIGYITSVSQRQVLQLGVPPVVWIGPNLHVRSRPGPHLGWCTYTIVTS